MKKVDDLFYSIKKRKISHYAMLNVMMTNTAMGKHLIIRFPGIMSTRLRIMLL